MATIKQKVFEFYAKKKEVCDRYYDEAEDSKISGLYFIEKENSNIDSFLIKTAVVILTANKYEKNLLHKNAYKKNSKKIARFNIELPTACNNHNKIYGYFFELNNIPILNLHATVTGSYTIGGSADMVRWVLSNKLLFPVAILSFGICFGLMEKRHQIGDVIISKKIYPYFIGSKINEKKLYVVDDNMFDINSSFLRDIQTMVTDNKFNNLNFKVDFGNYSTGEAVVSSNYLRQEIKRTTTQDVFAGDMEAYGLFKECNSYKYPLPCLTIKSICDWGIDKNYNADDEQTLEAFKNELNKKIATSLDSDDYTKLLKSLKDRLQAYAAQCAFACIDILFSEKDFFDKSLFTKMKKKLKAYNGVAISDHALKQMLCNILKKSNTECNDYNDYIYKCVTQFEIEGLLKPDNANSTNIQTRSYVGIINREE